MRLRPRRLSAMTAAAVALAMLPTAVPPALAAPAPTVAALGAPMVKPWHLSPSLVALRAEINARWPGRSRASDGSLGDARHRKTVNSHNRVGSKHGPQYGTTGAVHALDITAKGIDTSTVLAALIGDRRVWYVIFDGRIWSRTTGWVARRQTGDPHTSHIHVSLRDGSQATAVRAEDDTSTWLGKAAARSTTTSRGKLSVGTTRRLQKALLARGYRIPSGPTGWYGPETTKAVKRFQHDQGWSGSGADGVAGSQTLALLGVRAGTQTSGPSQATKKKAVAKKKAAAKKAAAKKAAAKKKAAGKKAAGKKAAQKAAAKKKATRKKASKRSGAVDLTAYTPGTADPKVYYLQQALIKRGYRIPAGPTGYYGVRTVEAVRQFQRDQGWTGKTVDGIPGTGTLRALGLI